MRFPSPPWDRLRAQALRLTGVDIDRPAPAEPAEPPPKPTFTERYSADLSLADLLTGKAES